MQMATNLSRPPTCGTGNIFNYNINNFTTTVYGDRQARSDLRLNRHRFLPFANHGFRISPGALLYNQNAPAPIQRGPRAELHSTAAPTTRRPPIGHGSG
jgi:hypothetical protein